MKGILFISHGKMAEGMVDSLTMFYGERPQNIDSLSLSYEEGMEKFKDELAKKIQQLNSDEGVLIFADLFGGTPANIASLFATQECEIITGMNLTIALECIGQRNSKKISVEELIETGKNGIISVNEKLSKK